MESLEAERDQYAQFVKHKQKLRRRAKWKRARFIICMLALPVGHFIVFFFYVNFNSVLMCFQNFNFAKNAVECVGWENFTRLYNEIRFLDDGRFITAIKNSFQYFFVSQFVLLPLGVLFAYFFFKQMPGYRVFRMIFFIPALIPGIVLPLLYGFMLDSSFGVLDKLLQAIGLAHLIPPNGWFGSRETAQTMLMIYVIWGGFGGNIVLITGNLNRMPAEIFESARIDGCSMRHEFVRLVLPMIWPTVSLLFVTGCTIIFTVYMPPFILTGGGPSGATMTIGLIIMSWTQNNQEYMAAAAGIVTSAIGIPMILLIKWGMSKVTPVVEY